MYGSSTSSSIEVGTTIVSTLINASTSQISGMFGSFSTGSINITTLDLTASLVSTAGVEVGGMAGYIVASDIVFGVVEAHITVIGTSNSVGGLIGSGANITIDIYAILAITNINGTTNIGGFYGSCSNVT
jgi:hypothetical protein